MPDRLRPAVRDLVSLTRRPRPRPEPLPPPPSASPAVGSGGVVDSAVYVAGQRVASPATLAETYRCLGEDPGALAWIGLYRPSPAELASLASEFHLHELAVEDAREAHQRPKVERYGDTLFVVLRSAQYQDAAEEVRFGELHLFFGPNFAVTLRHSESPDLSRVRARLEADPELLGKGSEAVLYAILDTVVDGYAPVVAGLANDIDEIEVQVFSGDPAVSRRIYELSQEVLEFQQAVRPLRSILASLAKGSDKYGVDEDLRSYLRDVADHATSVDERVEGFRLQLRDILTVNATLVAQRQNEELRELTETSIAQSEEVKKISAWAAILFAPTLVGTVYGMNFQYMPELEWRYGYPFALALMLAVSVGLYVVFKRRGWI